MTLILLFTVLVSALCLLEIHLFSYNLKCVYHFACLAFIDSVTCKVLI